MHLLITNNPSVRDRFSDRFVIEFIEDHATYGGVLERIRDHVHRGYRLLTHPLSGSVKPNETPYKSVMLEKGDTLDIDSLAMIESAMATMAKFQQNERTPNWTERVLEDFRVVDCSIMEHTIDRLGHV